jgi:UPF0755 protein
LKKKILILSAIFILLIAFLSYEYYQDVFESNVELKQDSLYIYIPSGSSGLQLLDSLKPFLKDTASFVWVANQKSYWTAIKSGRYKIENKWNNNQLINHLRGGKQAPINLILNNIKFKADLAEFFGEQLEAPADSFLELFNSERRLVKYDLEPRTVLSVFRPNSYQFYWNTSAEACLERMIKENDKFWSLRKDKLQQSDLNQLEVISLASIVESETAKVDEMPMVAGLYLNRLKQGIKLQSDPTVIYSIQQDYPDTVIRRVFFRDLVYDSPYNTYLNKGLPPGPIRIPNAKAIDAVLNAEKHRYIFMCANPEKPGYHSFATNLRGHNRNRDKYIRWVRAL